MFKSLNTSGKFFSPQNLFLYLGILIGSIHLYFVPALQAPDEFAHFYRALSISEGNLLPVKEDARLGDYLPGNIREIMFDHYSVSVNSKYKLNEENTATFFESPLNYSDSIFVDFPNTSYYSPVSYLPHSFFLFLLKPLHLEFGTLFYTVKILVYLVWLLCIFYFIRIVPVNKYLFVLLCLLPMHIYLANSFSADTVTIIVSLLFTGKVLGYTLKQTKLSIKHLTVLVVLACLLALAKIVYIGLVFTVVMLPKTSFRKTAFAFLFKGAVIFAGLLTAYLWSETVKGFYTPFAAYNPEFVYDACVSPCANYEGQKMFILSYPGYFPNVVWRSMFDHPYTYLHGYIGNLGNSDIPLPRFIIILGYILILFTVMFEKNEFHLRLSQKIILLGSSFCAFILLLLSQHLTWDCIGEGIVDLVQGRYLIPLLPWVFLLFSGIIKKRTVTPVAAIVFFVAFSNGVAISMINHRFYEEEYCEKMSFSCDAEKRDNKGNFISSDSTILIQENGCSTSRAYHSDTTSVKLSVYCPYGFTTFIKGVERGDLVEISTWQKGHHCNYAFVISGPKCDEVYYMGSLKSRGDTSLWRKHRFIFTITKACLNSRTAFYFWNPDTASVFLDDIELNIKKFDRDYLTKRRLSLFCQDN